MPSSSARPTKFVIDAMLGSLARKLRSFGFDALYYKEGDDAVILDMCRRQRRILVTADRALALHAEKVGLGVLPVSGRTDGERVAAMIAGAQNKGLLLVRGESLCSVCNGPLVRISRRVAEETLPKPLARKHRSFYRCLDCGKVYWRGSHWKKLRRLERLFENRR